MADVQCALERRARALQTELGMIETRIQKEEHDYIASTWQHGNVVRGWDAFARRALLDAETEAEAEADVEAGDTTGSGVGARTSTNRLAVLKASAGATTRAVAEAGRSNREDDDDIVDDNDNDQDEQEVEKNGANAPGKNTRDRTTAEEGVVEQLQQQLRIRRVRNADRVFSASSSSSRLRREKADVGIPQQRRVPIGGAVKKKRKRGV